MRFPVICVSIVSLCVGCGVLGEESQSEGLVNSSAERPVERAQGAAGAIPRGEEDVSAPSAASSGGQEDRAGDPPVMVGRDEDGNRGVRVGGSNGVVAGANQEVKGVQVGGKKGVIVGSSDEVKGVRVGGENGVMVGKDDQNSGVRIGGKKGVVIDGKKGIKIGGKKLFGK